MVRGLPPDYLPVDFITAGKAHGVPPDVMRRWLHRGEGITYLRGERRRFRAEICASNELHLQRLRESPNGMVGIKAVTVLEELDQDDALRTRREQMSPGLTIIIESPGRGPASPHTIDITPKPEREPDDAA
jgi:hypothetical protein